MVDLYERDLSSLRTRRERSIHLVAVVVKNLDRRAMRERKPPPSDPQMMRFRKAVAEVEEEIRLREEAEAAAAVDAEARHAAQ
ncbi:hypothetical protein AX769_05200 [Frondihabitans sp. PAMC 28766]|nr:hypothetical protein AX769_05200 [Frondihabitans sp. PAMC 28766]